MLKGNNSGCYFMGGHVRSRSSVLLYITEDLIAFGYEGDDAAWLDVLEGVGPADIKERRRGVYKEVIKILMRRVGVRPSKLKRWMPR